MKTLVLMIVLTLSILANVAHAGLDSYDCFCALVVAFRFESTKFNQEQQLTYTEGSSYQKHQGSLLNGATLSKNGKYGKSLHLTGESHFGSGTKIVPTLANKEFSVASWVRLPRQKNSVYFHVFGSDLEETYSSILLGIRPNGNLRVGHTIGEYEYIKETENQNVSDNRWHHIAFTKYLDTYYIFVDGEVVGKVHRTIEFEQQFFVGDYTITSITALGNAITGNVYIDDLLILSIGLSPYEIKGLYNDGIANFIEAMPVEAQGKVATTWGEIKAQR